MKVVCVVDSISDLNKKVLTIKNHFGNDILFIVKAPLVPIFQTFGYNISAVYDKNLAKIIHLTLLRTNVDDLIVYYTSLKIDLNLLSSFIKKIGNKEKIVELMPKYNAFERFCLKSYNIYVKAMFKNIDSLASPKLQFLPSTYVSNLLESHFGNKLFEMPKNLVRVCQTEEKEINKTAKIKAKFGKSDLIFLIIAMCLTLAFIVTLGFVKLNYILILLFIMSYLIDIFIYILLKCKSYFDDRFLK